MITLDKLRYFITAAESEHVGRAAQKANISASVISSAIKSIEEELGCELFVREKNRLKLNNQGHALLIKAKKILADIDDIPLGIQSKTMELKGHFKLGASHFLMQQYLVPAFLELQRKHPQLTVEFASLDSGLATSQILAGALDAALIFKSSYYHNLDEEIIYEDEFEIVVKDKHEILKKTAKAAIEELNRLPAITFRTVAGANFWENHPSFKELNIIPNHCYFYEDTQTALQLLSKTNGWAFLPKIIGKKHAQIKRVPLPKNLRAPVNISLIQSKSKNQQLLVSQLKELLLSKFAK